MPRQRVSHAMNEPAFLDWSEIGSPTRKLLDRFLRVKAGFVTRVRLFHRPIRFCKEVRPGGTSRFVPYIDKQQRPLGTVARYVINVIDRADGQVKVLEDCEDLFVQFRRAAEVTGVDPGGPDGFDLAVEVVGEGLKRVYRVSFDADCRTPFTLSERERIRQNMIHLPNFFAPSVD